VPTSETCRSWTHFVVVGHAGSGRRALLRTVFPEACWPSRRDHRSITVEVELIPEDAPRCAQARFSVGSGQGGSPRAATWVEVWGPDWCDTPVANGDALQEWIDLCINQWHDKSSSVEALRMHVRLYGPALPPVRLVLPPPYFADGTATGERTLDEIRAVVRAEADAHPTSRFLWAFPAPTDPANSSVRQDIIAACGVAERTTGVMTKCDLVKGEFDTSPASIIATKMRTLQADEPALGGGWITMANACSVKEATAAWQAAGSPEGELDRFKRANTLARERTTFDRFVSVASAIDVEERLLIAPDGVYGAAGLHGHIQHYVFDAGYRPPNAQKHKRT